MATYLPPLPLQLNLWYAIADALTDLSSDDPQLASQIAGACGFDGDEVGVARTLRLAALTGGHLPIMQALQLRLQQAGENGATLQPLAALAPDEWLDLAYTHGTPEGMTITPDAYADGLSASVERQYPTAALEEHLRDARRLARHNAFAEIGTFLRANPSFDIVTANLNALTEQAELQGIKQHERLVEGLRTLQRMNMLGASWEETATLLEKGYPRPTISWPPDWRNSQRYLRDSSRPSGSPDSTVKLKTLTQVVNVRHQDGFHCCPKEIAARN